MARPVLNRISHATIRYTGDLASGSTKFMPQTWQQPLPPIYNELSEAELRLRIQSAKDALGKRLVILGHHYQQDAVIDFANFTGDSFELSRAAAQQKNA